MAVPAGKSWRPCRPKPAGATEPMRMEQTQWRGIAVWELQSADALARISCFGGQLLSWQPAGASEVFWCSPQLQPPRPLRGGVPLCWPWFGKHPHDPQAPAHGLARTAAWQLDRVQLLEDGRMHLRLSPLASLHPGLAVEQQLWIGRHLEQAITSHNVGSQVEPLSQALHSYFQVADITAVRLLGVDGHRYSDALADGRLELQQGDWQFDHQQHGGRCDRIYLDVAGPVILDDPRQGWRLQLQAQGGRALVLWTPGPELGQQISDVGSGWQHYVCIEVANAGTDTRQLLPGQSHTLQQSIHLLD